MFWILILIVLFLYFVWIVKRTESENSSGNPYESDEVFCEKRVKIIAKLADDSCFSSYYNSAGMRFLSVPSGSVNRAAMGENKALTNERSNRCADSYITNEKYTLEQTNDLLNSWFHSYVRPEFVQSRLANIFSKLTVEEEKLTEMMIPITRAVVEYDIAFSQCMNIRNELGTMAQQIANEESKNKKASGLSYGIISNDFKAHALYAVLNNAEIKRQLAEQDRAIYNKASATNRIAIERQYEQILRLYSSAFSEKIREAVAKAYSMIP